MGTLKVWYIYQMLYLITLFFVKMSILAFYRRLSPAQGYHLAIKITAGLVTVFTISMVFVNVSLLIFFSFILLGLIKFGWRAGWLVF